MERLHELHRKLAENKHTISKTTTYTTETPKSPKTAFDQSNPIA